MGCDIHICTEAKQNINGEKIWVNVDNWRVNPYFGKDEWKTEKFNVEEIYRDRNYTLFAFLAGVRNYDKLPSFGFDRGLPKNVTEETKGLSDMWDCDGHTHGYCTLKELKEKIKGVSKIQRHAIVTKEVAEAYRTEGKEPDSWCRGVGCWKGIAPEFEDRYEWLRWEAKVNCFDKLLEVLEERKREVFWIFNKERDDFSHDKDFRIVFWFDN